MIPGFNTDIEHDGTTYHVQTEDKGLNSPLILSLIYTGGAILASKRTPYEDLIAAGLDEAVLAERLERQHKLICAAIKAGRIDDLKRLGEKGAMGGAAAPTPSSTPTPPPRLPIEPQSVFATQTTTPASDQAHAAGDNGAESPASPAPPTITKPFSTPLQPPPPEYAPPATPILQAQEIPTGKLPEKSFAETTLGTMTFDSKLMGTGPLSAVDLNALHLSLLDEHELRAGELAVLCIRVGRGMNGVEAVADAEVTIKILGTTFHPIIISQKTNQFGMTVARANLPKFAAGRAAVLVRAELDGKEAMLRRVIHRA